MRDDFSYIRYPELIVGIAGPIGIDIDGICEATSEALRLVSYESVPVKITDEIFPLSSIIKKPRRTDFYHTMKYKMDHASELCRMHDDPSFLMRISIAAIRRERATLVKSGKGLLEGIEEVAISEDSQVGDHGAQLSTSESNAANFVGPTARVVFEEVASTDKVAQKVSYIIRQIKRPDEVALLRQVYGRQFILISAYGSDTDRHKILSGKIRRLYHSTYQTIACRTWHKNL